MSQENAKIEKSVAQTIESLSEYFDEVAAAHSSNHANHHSSTADMMMEQPLLY